MNPDVLQDSVESRPSVQVPENIPADDIYSSYIFSTSNRKISKYGERLLMEVISTAQEYTIDAAYGINRLNFEENYNEKFAVIEIPIRKLLNQSDTSNYSAAKRAASELMSIYHTVETPVLDENNRQKTFRDGKPQYQFLTYHLLEEVNINRKPGIVEVKLGRRTWSQILDMGKGYTRYNLLNAKNLDNEVAIRLFQWMSNTEESLYFTIDRIKSILGMQDQYLKNSSGFISRVIVPAEKEINEKCAFCVGHECVYGTTGRVGKPSIIGVIFRKEKKAPVGREEKWILDPELEKVLTEKFGFERNELFPHLSLFGELKRRNINAAAYLLEKESVIRKHANDLKGYVIKSLKNLLNRVDIPVQAPVSASKGQKPASGTAKEKNPGRLFVSGADAFGDSGMEEL